MENKKEGKSRIEVIDSLRGFAIMGILLLHSIEHFNLFVYPELTSQPAWLGNLDSSIWDSLFFLFSGKAYAIFALLFGFTFGLMMRKQRDQNKDFGYRFLWRMVLLAGFAVLNGLFFPGEVLMMYALLGTLLFFVRNLTTQHLLYVALFLLLQPIEWLHYLYYVVDNTHVASQMNDGKYWGLVGEGQLSESIIQLFTTNTLYGHKASLIWSYNVGRMVQTVGLFVLGYWIEKKQLFSHSTENNAFWTRTLLISIMIFIPFYLLKLNFKDFFELKIHRDTIYNIVSMYGNFAFTFFLISSFILLYNTQLFRKIAGGLRYCGRMSLTAYITQSIVGSFVFYNYGLGIGVHIGSTVSLGIGVLLFILQLSFCKLCISKYGQGPFEKLWHTLTWIHRN